MIKHPRSIAAVIHAQITRKSILLNQAPKMSNLAPQQAADAGMPASKYIDPAWRATTEWCQLQTQPASKPNTDILAAALKNADAAGLPPIYAAPAQAKFLALQAKALGAKNFLEVGTLGGYTSLWTLTLNPKLRVTTVEVDPHHAATARKNFTHAGKEVEERVTVLEGPGVEVLPKVLQEFKEGKREAFDIVFIDADKSNNWKYFETAVQMTRPGGIIFVDNVVRGGKIVDPAWQHDGSVKGAREVIQKAGADPRVESSVIQLSDEKGFDGMVMSVVN